MMKNITRQLKRISIKLIIGIILVVLCLISTKTHFFVANNIHVYSFHKYSSEKANNSDNLRFLQSKPQCPSVLENMLNGIWHQRPMTANEILKMETFLDVSRKQHGLNITLQRNDSRCGNVSFPPKKGSHMKWFRGLCDRRGNTPCCFNNHCVNRSPEQCRCKNCYDMRQPIHAEYSQFIPSDSRCQIKQFNYQQACDLLSNGTIAFVGDSYIRHIYTSVLMFLRNNYDDGALKKNVKKDIRDQCSGMYMFTEIICRLHLEESKTSDICDGNVNLKFRYFYASAFGQHTKKLIETEMLNRPRSLLLFGVGLHDHFNTTKVKSGLINGLYELTKKTQWPRLLWATPHCPGILKNGNEKSQSKPMVMEYISKMNGILSSLHIPQFNTYNMTEGVMSFDGNHYGLGVNWWKFQILLNYIQELKNKDKW